MTTIPKPQGVNAYLTNKKYDNILKVLPATMERVEIIFLQAGDGMLKIEYGFNERMYIPDSMRINAVDELLQKKKIKGVIETVPTLRANQVWFDPTVLNINKLIDEITEIEDNLPPVADLVLHSRQVRLPIAFEDNVTKDFIKYYVDHQRAESPYINEDYGNMDYVAQYNGLNGKQDIKDIVLNSTYYNSGHGFWPGGAFWWNMDPRVQLYVPKYNPPRMRTHEGAVGMGGPCLYIYSTPSGGGYQLFGRTIPIFQFSLKHPQYKDYDSPLLFRVADRLSFYEVDEEEILYGYEHIHNQTDYKYDIDYEGEIVVKDFIEWYHSPQIQEEAAAFKKKQAEAVAVTPKP
ncbi:MAG: carboxyltransferase domain-containing protein [Eubacteriales bacterium]|nr:carboxyltransferase domain-containing protein [Eubacteriales bacterium]